MIDTTGPNDRTVRSPGAVAPITEINLASQAESLSLDDVSLDWGREGSNYKQGDKL